MSTIIRKSVIGKPGATAVFQITVDSVQYFQDSEALLILDVHYKELCWKIRRCLKEIAFFALCIAEYTAKFKAVLPSVLSNQVQY